LQFHGIVEPMRRAFIFVALTAGVALGLAACAADSHSSVPEFMRAQASEPPPPEPPDVKRIVHDKIDSLFVSTSSPQHVRVSPPHRDVRGLGWGACVRAEVMSATGKPLGMQTYRITISDGEITDRMRVGNEDNCVSETYEPIEIAKSF
jgi:hypothetical protein